MINTYAALRKPWINNIHKAGTSYVKSNLKTCPSRACTERIYQVSSKITLNLFYLISTDKRLRWNVREKLQLAHDTQTFSWMRNLRQISSWTLWQRYGCWQIFRSSESLCVRDVELVVGLPFAWATGALPDPILTACPFGMLVCPSKAI